MTLTALALLALALLCQGAPLASMPRNGFGTCCRKTSKGPALVQSVKAYLGMGGRLIDTALSYQNHRDIAAAIAQSGVARESIWITSKVNTVSMARTADAIRSSVNRSLMTLNTTYIDLMLIHTPAPNDEINQKAWTALTEEQKKGHVRYIGVSNFDENQTLALLEVGEKPFVNQLEYHPFVPERMKALRQWCAEQGILVTAYGSLGGASARPQSREVVKDVADKYKKSPAQVLLRWALDQDLYVIPGATSPEHIRENLAVEDFKLEPAEVLSIGNLTKPSPWRSLLAKNMPRLLPVRNFTEHPLKGKRPTPKTPPSKDGPAHRRRGPGKRPPNMPRGKGKAPKKMPKGDGSPVRRREKPQAAPNRNRGPSKAGGKKTAPLKAGPKGFGLPWLKAGKDKRGAGRGYGGRGGSAKGRAGKTPPSGKTPPARGRGKPGRATPGRATPGRAPKMAGGRGRGPPKRPGSKPREL